MTQKHSKKVPKFQFGTPFEVPCSGGIQARISVDFKKVLNSWFNVRDLLPPSSGNDGDKLKNIMPSIFQGQQNQSSTKSSKSVPRTSNQTTKRFYIDISKLEGIKTLSLNEKENLKQILNELKCSNDKEKKQSKPYKEAKKRQKRTPKQKRAKKAIHKENKVKKNSCDQKKKTSKATKAEKSMSKLSQYSECKICSEIFDKSYKSQTRKQRQPPTTIASSAEKLLQTLMADPRAFGDIAKRPNENIENNSCSSINTIFRKNQNICIKNIELKYLKPTYVVQYSANETSANNEPPNRPYVRDRLYSAATLDAHLGQTSAPDYHEGKPHAAKTSMHYEESNLHIIGMGHQTEEMLRERGNSDLSGLKREGTTEYDPAVYIKLPPPPQGERVTKWQRDPIPSFLLPSQQQDGSISSQTNPVKGKKEPKSKKCIDFVKKCLCLYTEKKDDRNMVDKVDSEIIRIHKEDFLKAKKKSPPTNKNDANVTRVTHDTFFNGRESTMKKKQKPQKKGKTQKVSFQDGEPQ